MLKSILFVGAGSFMGGSLRFYISYLLKNISLNFPYATMTVNVLGCLLIGILIALGTRFVNMNQNLVMLLVTGFCGGFTTFSTFSYEGFLMLQCHNYLNFSLYVGGSIILGLLAVFIGYQAVIHL